MTLHLAKRIKFRTIAACGLWAIEQTTKNVFLVTCARCMRTTAFRRAGQSSSDPSVKR